MVLWFIEHSFCGLRFCGSVTGLMDLQRQHYCNVNGNGNDNGIGNSGEALRGSTGLLIGNSFYGSRSGGTTVCKGNEELRGAAVY